MAHIDLRDRSDDDLEEVRALVSREAERPLSARISVASKALQELLLAMGFVETGEEPDDDSLWLELPPTLE